MTEEINNGSAPAQPNSSSDAGSQSAPIESHWFIDEGIAGVGERPNWLPEKFKTVKNMADSYSALEKRFSAPSGDYDLSKGEGWIDKEFEPIKDLFDAAKKSQVPQEVIDKMLSSVGDYLNKDSFDRESEIKKLGDGFEKRIEVLENWGKSNLSEKGFNSLMDMAMSADDILALEELRNLHMNNQNQVPTSNQVASTPQTLKDVQEEIISNYDKYKTDKGYREQMRQKIEKLVVA